MDSGRSSFSSLSCNSCRRLKRKCSKQWPQCALCSRVGRCCDYPTPESTPAHDTAVVEANSQPQSGAPIPRARDIRRHARYQTTSYARRSSVLPSPSSASVPSSGVSIAACFLDSVATRGRSRVEPTALKWDDVNEQLAALTTDDATNIIYQYRQTAHQWLPVVSLKLLQRQLKRGNVLQPADTTALLYAMSLLSGETAAETELVHQGIRIALRFCEDYGQLSNDLVAAHILVTAYELSQGLYPAADYAVAHCSRLCMSFGFHDKRKATQLLPKADTWTEVEARRRLWWAAMILDRYAHVGFRFRPSNTPGIPASELLPADDESWDHGQMAVNPLLVMSVEALPTLSPYGRTCQAAHLLGRVCQHVNEHPTSEEADVHFQEAYQISQVTKSLLTMLDAEDLATDQPNKLFPSRALCFSALLLLYDVHSCVEVDEIEACGGSKGLRLDLQQLAIDGMDIVASQVCSFADELDRYIHSQPSGGLHSVSPLVLNCLYSAAGVFAWRFREAEDDDHLFRLNKLREMLASFREAYPVAGGY